MIWFMCEGITDIVTKQVEVTICFFYYYYLLESIQTVIKSKVRKNSAEKSFKN